MNETMADERAAVFDSWVRAYGDDILRVCLAYLRNRADAEDASQETFLKAWQGLAGFADRHGSGAKPWLMRIAMNVCRDHYRSGWFRHVDRSWVPDENAVGGTEPADRAVTDAVLGLPGKLKQVLLLYYYQNMTVREVAEALQLSPAGVHKRLKAAEKRLREQLEEEV